ncbi:hypothetical protein BZA70DRAFT_294726 [Myxozyma melibiosi]|uniref:DUF221-domain-containing protein n=1 Tax=Myxozyma melibiosi TaxID=54550 RepID=A0ABR1F9C7_9ASCO
MAHSAQLQTREDEDKGQILLDLLQNSFASAQITGKAVWVGLLISLGSSAAFFALFCLLRTRNTILYAPKTRISGLSKHDSFSTVSSYPRLRPGYFKWMLQIYKLKESDLLFILGLDFVVYLKFLKMNCHTFLCLAILGVTVAIPVNFALSINSPSAKAASASDAFILMTPTLLKGPSMACHVALAYVFDAIVCFFLWKNYKEILQLRKIYFTSFDYQSSIHARTLLITELSKPYRSNEGIIKILKDAAARSTIASSSSIAIDQIFVGRSVRGLGKLVRMREKTVYRLEKVFAKYLKDLDNLPATRPMMKLDRGDKFADGSRGGKVDAIDYLVTKIRDYDYKIAAARKSVDSRREMPYGFASYHSATETHLIAKANSGRRVLGAGRIRLAPRSKDILWENIELTSRERLNKKYWGNAIFIIFCIGWIVPNAFIGTFLSQISRIGVLSDSFQRFANTHAGFISFIQGFVAPAVTSAIFLIFPIVMRRISAFQGAHTKSMRERNALRKLYIFFVFNNLIVFTMFGVAWSAISQIIQLSNSRDDMSAKEIFDSLDLAEQISSSIIGVSSFWVMYVVRSNLGALLDLIQVWSLLVHSFARRFLAPTPRAQIRWTAPPEFDFASHYNWLLFYATIALTFTSIQPIILVVTCFYFTIDTFLKKYSLIYVYMPKVESDGAFWKDLFNRILFSLALGNAVMFIVTWVQGTWRVAVAMLPLFPAILAFKIYSYYAFSQQMKYNLDSQSLESITPPAQSSSAHTDPRNEFGNPALYRTLIVPIVKKGAENILEQILGSIYLDSNSHGPSASGALDGAFEIVDERELDFIRFLDDPNLRDSEDPAPRPATSLSNTSRQTQSLRSLSSTGMKNIYRTHSDDDTISTSTAAVPPRSASMGDFAADLADEDIVAYANPYDDGVYSEDNVLGISFATETNPAPDNEEDEQNLL